MEVATRNQYAHINTATSTLCKTGPGTLHNLIVSTRSTGIGSVTMYDGTSAAGTVIGILDSTNNFGDSTYDVAFTVGLFIVTAAATTPADVTVSFA